MARRHARLVVIPEAGGDTRQFRIPLLPRGILAGAALGALLLMGLTVFGAIELWRLRADLAGSRTENLALRRELVKWRQEVGATRV